MAPIKRKFSEIDWTNVYMAVRGWRELDPTDVNNGHAQILELIRKAPLCDYCGRDYLRDEYYTRVGLWELKNLTTGKGKKICLACLQHHCDINQTVCDTEPQEREVI